MAQQAAEDQGGTERMGRGPLWAGKPAGAGAGPAEVEARLVRLETGFDDLKLYFERSEERWEKWRSEQQQQAEFGKEVAAGFQRLDEKIDAVREETGERIGRLAESVDRHFDQAEKFSDRVHSVHMWILTFIVTIGVAVFTGAIASLLL